MFAFGDFYEERGWTVVHQYDQPGRSPQRFSTEIVELSEVTQKYVTKQFPSGLYRHQMEAVRQFTKGDHVCLNTGTASGKSAAFYCSGIETLAKEPKARILAIYPMKALAAEQEDRWREAIRQSGLTVQVGRIDGSVSRSMRNQLLTECRVVVATPDVVHAWFLYNLAELPIRRFLSHLKLVVVDEVHTYTGVFGSNAAFLFRRLAHACDSLGTQYQYVCASATIRDPANHLRQLFGEPFALIGENSDTSPRYPVTIEMVSPPKDNDFLTETTALLKYLSTQSRGRFIAFVDGRRQTEMITSILARNDTDEPIADPDQFIRPLEHLDILPYRAGYEEQDRLTIQNRLSGGGVRGVVCTSALELGMDLPHLDVAVLIGVPASNTNFIQRMGRIGRHGPGHVIVVNSYGVYDQAVFRNPELLMNRPLAESALYLENPRIQYIHALCLARLGGEYDSALRQTDPDPSNYEPSQQVEWPPGFVELCRQERMGQVPKDLQPMKSEAGDQPNTTYPLRDVETQFEVELVQGPHRERLGSLSHAQVLREAYPGAVYYYATQPYRVYRILTKEKRIQVRRESRYFTSPMRRPTMVFPGLSEDQVYQALSFGSLVGIEADLQINETVYGVRERRGSKEMEPIEYPFSPAHGLANVYFDRDRFSRTYFTTGVTLFHPAFDGDKVEMEALARLVYEAFLLVLPFERRDLGFAVDRLRQDNLPMQRGSRFICIYDETYGSLRLSGRILEDGVLVKMGRHMQNLAEASFDEPLRDETWEAMLRLVEDARNSAVPYGFLPSPQSTPSKNQRVKVIRPGSVGLAVRNNNEWFKVENVFFSPRFGTIAYRGSYPGRMSSEDVAITWPQDAIVEIPGVTEFAEYDLETGEILELDRV
ncbi:DEAD/DEAH box helicase [Kyrpidia spormannii]|nr:DEAD/DEAH box helicase [Kyrpidia spormannii]